MHGNMSNIRAFLVVIQVLASFLVQDLESEGLNPFLLTYIANSLFIIYLPIYYLTVRLIARKHNARRVLSTCIGVRQVGWRSPALVRSCLYYH